MLRPLLDQWHIAAFEQLGTVAPEQRPVNLLRREGQCALRESWILCPRSWVPLPIDC